MATRHELLLLALLTAWIEAASQGVISGGIVSDKIVGLGGTNGSAAVSEDASVDSLLNLYIRNAYEAKALDGYRIQLYSGSGTAAKREALAAKAKFLGAFPDEKVYTVYTAPFWRVRVGDYRHRCEALPLLRRIRASFPGCYTVKDNTIRKSSFR